MSDETTPSRPSLATLLQDRPATGTPAPAAPARDRTAEEARRPAPASEPVQATLIDDTERQPELAEDESETPTAGAPSFIRGARATVAPPRATPRWQWMVVAALALLLTVQILVADRARLAADASTRPLVSGLCAVLRCSLPAWHEPSAYAMLSREIRPVPGLPGVLQVQASFRNEARWAQAWPALNLALSDADGRVIGRRTLQPSEYLGAGADPLARLEPGQSAQVSFRLREPAAGTVAFSFEFQ